MGLIENHNQLETFENAPKASFLKTLSTHRTVRGCPNCVADFTAQCHIGILGKLGAKFRNC